MNLEVVTSFSQSGYSLYGKRFVESFCDWDDHRMICYHESQADILHHPQLVWRNLDGEFHRMQFLQQHASDPEKVGDRSDFNSQSIRFCHKVFALADAADTSDAEWLVWMDADVVLHGAPDWSRCLPESASLSYLGRDPDLNKHWVFRGKWRPICSETGFVGYRLADKCVRAMIEDMRSYYTTGEIYTRQKTDWHDAKAFDVARERSSIPKDRWHNLCRGLAGTDVWPMTELAKWSKHHKGEKRKAVAYGGIVS